MTNTLYSWNFSSKKQRWTLWYTLVLSIVIWLVIWGFLTKQYGMSFLILLLTGLVYFVENNSADIVNVDINELWVKVWESFYDFSNISSFTLVYEWENAIFLRLNLTRKWLRYIDLNIDNDIALNAKEVLQNFVEENWKSDISFIDKLIKLLKL